MKKNTKDILIIGFALFAMFFGAGNLIFPPFLGNAVGSQYLIASIGFICTGVGLPLLAIIAVTKGDGTFETMASRISPKFAIAFATLLFIAIGPMLAIPRTAATTYELAVQP
ncbi:branched-chain amino acid transport system II carrier protein, partial [uncultured Clostridium sp.]|uniref:branched-chain amino acid transport system II carrier protein n=1 Tax=uncultured Clostridium sp. TaxID=59620 RepID=UPI0025FF5073